MGLGKAEQQELWLMMNSLYRDFWLPEVICLACCRMKWKQHPLCWIIMSHADMFLRILPDISPWPFSDGASLVLRNALQMLPQWNQPSHV